MSRRLTSTWGAARPDARGGVQGLHHVPGQPGEVLVEDRHRLRLFGESRVSDLQDIELGHEIAFRASILDEGMGHFKPGRGKKPYRRSSALWREDLRCRNRDLR